MRRTVSVPLDQLKELFLILEELNGFFHEPDNYEAGKIRAFMGDRNQGGYAGISRAYYELVWNWIPDDIQQEILNR